MDLGRFMSSRLRLGLWLGLPVVLMLAVTVPSHFMLASAQKELRLYQGLQEVMPDLEMRTRKAEQLLKSVTPPLRDAVLATDEVTRRINESVANSSLMVRSVKVDDQVGQAGAFRTVLISTQLQGSLRDLVQWLDRVQKPGLLISVQSAHINALAAPPDETVSGEFVMAVYLRTS